MAKTKFSVGQRWSYKPVDENFEPSFVIAGIDPDNRERPYVLYVQFSAAGRQKLLPRSDGVTLVLTPAQLEGCADQRLETKVELPWWWEYGVQLQEGGKTPGSRGRYQIKTLKEGLPRVFGYFEEKARLKRGQKAALDRSKQQKKSAKKKGPPKNIAESWQRLSEWYAENAPGYAYFKLSKGASAKQIAAAEKTLGVTLPDDFKESVRIHDGGDCWIQPYYGDLLSLKRIVEQWKMYRQWQKEKSYADPESADLRASRLRGPAKRIFWNTKRIYVTDNSGNHLTLDLDPPREGKYGQLIAHDHEVGPTKVVAASWTEFLAALVKDHESGKYVYVPEEDSVCLLKELKG